MKIADHSASNRGIAAFLKREALSRAAKEWMKTEPNDEADIAFEAVLLNNGVIDPDDVVYEIYSDAPETVMVRVNGNTLIEIDVESGCHLRGQADE